MIRKNDCRLVAFLSYNIYVKYDLKILTLLYWKFFIWQICVWVWLHRNTWKKKTTVRKIHLKSSLKQERSQGMLGCDLRNQGYHGDGLHHREQSHQTTDAWLCYMLCVWVEQPWREVMYMCINIYEILCQWSSCFIEVK